MADGPDDYMDVTIVLKFRGLFTFVTLDKQVYVLLPRTDRNTGNPHGGFPPHRASLDIVGTTEPQNFGDCCLHIMPPGGSPQIATLPPLMDLTDITRGTLPRGHCRGAVNSRCSARIELGNTWQPSIYKSEHFEVPFVTPGAGLDDNPESDCNYRPCKEVAAWIQFRTVRRVRRRDPVDLGLLRLDRQHQKPQPFQLQVPVGVSTLTLVCCHLPIDEHSGAGHEGGNHGETHFDAYYDLYDGPVKRCPVRPCEPNKSSSTKTCPSTKASVD